jgi:hypothetical protein
VQGAFTARLPGSILDPVGIYVNVIFMYCFLDHFYRNIFFS